MLQVQWLPDPVRADGENSWKSFEEVYGTETSDAQRPSLSNKPVSAEDTENKALFIAGKFIICD